MSYPTPLEMAVLAEDIEVKAWKSLCEAVPPQLARSLGLALEERDGLLISSCRTYDDFLANRAFGPGFFTQTDSKALVSGVVEHFRARGSRNFALQISRRLDAYGGWVGHHGLERRNSWVVLCRDSKPAPVPTTTFRIEEIPARERDAFARVAGAGFGWEKPRSQWHAATVGCPGWHHYLAYDGSKPIASGAFYSSGDVAWLGMATTIGEYRRRGAQRALLARRINDALDLGCRWIVAETGEANPSYRNLIRAGFWLMYLRDNFCERPQAAKSPVASLASWWRGVMPSSRRTPVRSAAPL